MFFPGAGSELYRWLLHLHSNSWFQPTGPGKRTGNFLNGSLRTTGTLTTGSYVTVVPVAPPLG